MKARSEHLCYTDGACKAAHDGAGGWGYHIRPPEGAPLEGYGRAANTLAKTMEYQAVAEALAVLPEGARATVYSDNQSLVETLTRQLDAWRDNGFAKADPDVVESLRRIGAAIGEKHLAVRFQWVRGHAGNAGNERADELAAQGAREAKAELGARRKR